MDRNTRIEQLKNSRNVRMNKPRAQRRPPVGGKWSKDEDRRLKEIVEAHGPKNWKHVCFRHSIKYYLGHPIISCSCRSRICWGTQEQMYSACIVGTRF